MMAGITFAHCVVAVVVVLGRCSHASNVENADGAAQWLGGGNHLGSYLCQQTCDCGHRRDDQRGGVAGHTLPRDCAELQYQGETRSGVYTVYVGPQGKPTNVYCDLQRNDGGWMIIQRRQNGFVDFYRHWDDFANGFGDIFGEFWMGNLLLHLISQEKDYILRVDMEDFDNESRHAEYSMFKVGTPTNKYRLQLGQYSGNAGDGMSSHSNGSAFSTIDQDNDRSASHCAQEYKGGWWHGDCHQSNLNGLYHAGQHDDSFADGVNWQPWRGYHYSLKFTEMKLRPVHYYTENNDAGN